MEILIKAGQLLLSLSILILLHEFGHFIAARIFKTRVEKFYLFFNPGFSLFKFKRGETEYGLGWLPLGGYVKISGMIDESMDKEQMKQPPQPWEFRSKPAWQRLIIMLGGIIMNVILGIVIYWMIIYFYGESYVPNENLKYGIAVNEVGWEMGFQNGDRIIAIDGKSAKSFDKVASTIIIDRAEEVTVERNGQIITFPVSPSMIKKVIDNKAEFIEPRFPFVLKSFAPTSVAKDAGMEVNDQIIAINDKPTFFYDEVRKECAANKDKTIAVEFIRGSDTLEKSMTLGPDGLLGVKSAGPAEFFKMNVMRYSFFGAIPAGTRKAYETLSMYVKQFALIFSPEIQGYKHVGGFISIANVFDPKWDWLSFWSWTGFLSIALAFMNLLPIPALDGGHVMFTLYEMVTRRKPNDKFLEYAQITGMILLFALLIYANGNDIVGLFR